MALNYSGQLISGLSSDSKPTNVPIGFTFYETDTKNAFRFNGTAWVGAMICMGGAGIGYGVGAGGTVTQGTNKATTVVLNKLSGAITTHNAALAAGAIVSFTVTNSTMAATDVVAINHSSGGTLGAYTVMPNTPAAGSFRVTLRNNTAGSLGEALVLRFAIIRGAVS
jgi:hypothetical protein